MTGKNDFIFVGPPAAGKGTQADLLKRKINSPTFCHLSTGDMLRDAVEKKTEIGKIVEPVMKSGGLVADDIMIDLVKYAVTSPSCADGFILDGFPRTLNQAQHLDAMLDEVNRSVNKVFYFKIPDSDVLKRILGRLTHKSSGRTYHEVFAPPKVPMTDDITGEPLERRKDDNEEALKKRLESYHQWTTDVIKYYDAKHKVVPLEASKKSAAVFDDILSALKE